MTKSAIFLIYIIDLPHSDSFVAIPVNPDFRIMGGVGRWAWALSDRRADPIGPLVPNRHINV
jgi:hypothetical protein